MEFVVSSVVFVEAMVMMPTKVDVMTKSVTYLPPFVGSGKSQTSCRNRGWECMPIVTMVTILLLGGVLNAIEGKGGPGTIRYMSRAASSI